MYCPNCNQALADNVTVCPVCGERVTAVQPQYQPQVRPVNPAERAQAGSVLAWGIVGLVFAWTFVLSFLGVIFSAIGLGKAKSYRETYGPLSGKTKVGQILSRIGLILGIVLTVSLVLIVVAIIALVSAGEIDDVWEILEDIARSYP